MQESSGSLEGRSKASTKASNRQIILLLGGFVLGMFGFGYALVPLYDLICEVTGLNGASGSLSQPSEVKLAAPTDREVTLQFVTTINGVDHWTLTPPAPSMKVRPGEMYQVDFRAVNLTGETRVAQATPSVAPWAAGKYLNKTECFCFTQQPFTPGESRDLGLTFVVDPALPDHIDTLTLSYTFFDATNLAAR